MKQSNFSVALSTADLKVKQIADYVIDSDQPDDLIKLMKKIYYAKDPISYLYQLKTEKK
jgi:hydroxymethylpyrimidine pyrophosphatase-like HAD family hydrolase